MFRPISLLCKNRAITLKRFYCKPKEKCFIINTKDEGKKVVYESQILQKFREQVEQSEKQVYPAQNPIMRMMETLRRLMMCTRQQSTELIQTWKVQENFLKLKNAQKEKLNMKILIMKENFKFEEIPARAKQKWQLVKASDCLKYVKIEKPQIDKIRQKILSFKENNKLSEIPARTKAQLEVLKSSDGFKRFINLPEEVARYWVVFMKSETRARLEEVIVWMWIEGKTVTMKIIKFIREAYFDKPVKPETQEKK